MNRKFWLTTLAVFVVWMAGDFFVHGVLLHDDYGALPQLYRSEADAQPYFSLMLFAHLMMAAAFVWIYGRGREARPWLGQGLRFGLAVALMSVVPGYLIYFVVQPLPSAIVCKQIFGDGVLMLVLGAVTAFLYRDAA